MQALPKENLKSSDEDSSVEKSSKNNQGINDGYSSDEKSTTNHVEGFIGTGESVYENCLNKNPQKSVETLESREMSISNYDDNIAKDTMITEISSSDKHIDQKSTIVDQQGNNSDEIICETVEDSDKLKNIAPKTKLELSQAKTSVRITKDLSSKFKNSLIFELDD